MRFRDAAERSQRASSSSQLGRLVYEALSRLLLNARGRSLLRRDREESGNGVQSPAARACGSLCARAGSAARLPSLTPNASKTRAETSTAPRISPWGRLLTARRAGFVKEPGWLRVRRSLRTLSVNAFGTDSYLRTDPRRRSRCDSENLRRERWDRFAASHRPIVSPSPRGRVPSGHVERKRGVPAPAGL